MYVNPKYLLESIFLPFFLSLSFFSITQIDTKNTHKESSIHDDYQGDSGDRNGVESLLLRLVLFQEEEDLEGTNSAS